MSYNSPRLLAAPRATQSSRLYAVAPSAGPREHPIDSGRVRKLDDDQIRAIVKTGQISDPAADEYLVNCLIQRRDKIGKTFFAKVLPLDLFAVRDGELVFEDLAKKHGLGAAGPPLKVSWPRFDNETEQKTPLTGQGGFAIPLEATPGSAAAYYAADISREGDVRRTITVYLRIRRG
jgi:hypothetical protein